VRDLCLSPTHQTHQTHQIKYTKPPNLDLPGGGAAPFARVVRDRLLSLHIKHVKHTKQIEHNKHIKHTKHIKHINSYHVLFLFLF
jgi:hypothetical protein